MGLFQRSMAAAVFIVCTLVLRRLAFNKLPGRTFAVLWKMAVLRLLLPFSFRVGNWFIQKQASPVMLSVRKEAEKTAMEAEAIGLVQFFLRNIGLIWFLGVALLALFFTVGYIRAYFQLREAIPCKDFGGSDEVVGKYGGGLTKGVNVCILDRVAAPITYGIFCPRIILPKAMDFTDKDMLGYVLKHEMIHIKRRDNLWKFLLIAAFCLHWFNPFVLIMYFLMNRDMEIACDEGVISSMGKKDRQKYAMALVTLAEKRAFSPVICSGFGESAVSERIRRIMDYKKITKIGSLCAALIMLGGMAVFVSAKETGPEPAIEAEPLSAANARIEGEEVENHKDEECVSVYFDAGISEERIEEIGNELLAMDGVLGVGYTSAEDAWAFFAKEYLGEEIVVSFKENPLKDSANYTVYLSEKSEAVVRFIEGIDGVRAVR